MSLLARRSLTALTACLAPRTFASSGARSLSASAPAQGFIELRQVSAFETDGVGWAGGGVCVPALSTCQIAPPRPCCSDPLISGLPVQYDTTPVGMGPFMEATGKAAGLRHELFDAPDGSSKVPLLPTRTPSRARFYPIRAEKLL